MTGEVTLTAAEFDMLCKLRSAQKLFYGTFHPDRQTEHQAALIDSKRLEKAVDALIERKRVDAETPNLFGQNVPENSA